MKRVLVFLLLSSVGGAALVHYAGGLRQKSSSNVREQKVEKRRAAPSSTVVPIMGTNGIAVETTEKSTVLARSKTMPWRDRGTGKTHQRANHIAWKCHMAVVHQSERQPVNSELRGVECSDVVIHTYRLPRTLAEARAAEDDLEVLVAKKIVAKRAYAQGSFAQRLDTKLSKMDDSGKRDMNAQTSIQLLDGVTIHDVTQGVTVKGDELTVWPAQDRMEGRGAFVARHQAFVLHGKGLRIDRNANGWWRMEVRENPELRVLKSAHAAAKLPGGIRTDKLEPSRIRSPGTVVIVLEEGRRESRLRISFRERVVAEQADGKTLRAGALDLDAVQPPTPTEKTRWRIRRLEAHKGVEIEYPETTERGDSYLVSAKANRMIHQIPRDGTAHRSELIGRPAIVVRGRIPVGYESSDKDRLHITCIDRAWIDAPPEARPDVDLPFERLRQISLRGGARIERHGVDQNEDIIDADSIDFLIYVPKDEDVQPAKRHATQTSTPDVTKLVAIEFAARGHVRLSGSRIHGATDVLVAQNLHTHAPHIFAEGEDASYAFKDVDSNQRFARRTDNAKAARRNRSNGVLAGNEVEQVPESLRWVFYDVVAEGSVEIRTSHAGPSLGVGTFTSADKVHYNNVHGTTSILGSRARPASIRVDSGHGEEHRIDAPRINMDQRAGIVIADGGVDGDLYFREGGISSFDSPGTAPEENSGDALTFEIKTNHRVDLFLARTTATWTPDLNARQRVVFAGPVRAELRSSLRVVDQLRADRVTLSLRPEDPNDASTSASPRKTSPLARMNAPRSSPTKTRQADPKKASPPTHLKVKATRVTAHLDGSSIRMLDASGGVHVRGDIGRLTGNDLHVDVTQGIARLLGGAHRRSSAEAIFGTGPERSEIRAKSFTLGWSTKERRASTLDAVSYPKFPSRIRFARPAAKGEPAEHITIMYQGSIRATGNEMRFGRVQVIREGRAFGSNKTSSSQRNTSRRAELRAPQLLVRGRNMLSNKGRAIDTITAWGEPTYFASTLKQGKAEIWAQRAVYDIQSGNIKMSGTPAQEVEIRLGEGTRPSQLPEFTVNLKNGSTSADRGGDIVVRPR